MDVCCDEPEEKQIDEKKWQTGRPELDEKYITRIYRCQCGCKRISKEKKTHRLCDFD
jgi:hypothetical protein